MVWDPQQLSKKIVTMSTYTLIGLVLSWIYFFITLPYFIRLVGKIQGPTLNYGISWILMICIIYILQKLNPEIKTLESVES
jgi:hypothetical protein